DDQAEAVSSLPAHIPGPEKLGIRIDGAAYTPIYKFNGDIREVDYLRADLSSIAFQLRPSTTSLVIGSGGGRDLLMARLFDHQVTGVDINPIITDTIMRDEFQDYSGGIYTDPSVTIHVAEGRSFVSQSQESFDVITIPLVDTWASTINGNLALVESYLYTTEAFATYLERLTPDGILSVSRWEQSGPRLLSLFLDAAEQLAITEPENKIMVIENDPRIGGQLHNVLMKRQAFTPDEITQVEAFAEANNFKILYAPDSERGTVYDDYLRAPDRDEFVRTFSKNLLASTDDQPFFFFLLNFKHFNGREIGSFDGGLLAAAIAVFAFSVFTIGFPGLTFSGYRQLRGHGKTFLRYAGYFGGLGIGFILIELALIQKFVLYLEHPIYSYSVVLAGLLLFAGFGSVISARLNPLRNKSIILVGVGITLVQLFYALGLSPLISATLGWSIASKITMAALLTIPSAILMGMLLPLGFKRLELTGHQQLIPMSWAVNGAASVMGSTLAIILAIQFGFTRVLLIAAGVYLLGILCLISDRRPTVIVDNQL
ncbi:MAG TPA: hypothetical protein VGA08_04090, partial [Candidatus Saccharimonadales bacterium]